MQNGQWSKAPARTHCSVSEPPQVRPCRLAQKHTVFERSETEQWVQADVTVANQPLHPEICVLPDVELIRIQMRRELRSERSQCRVIE